MKKNYITWIAILCAFTSFSQGEGKFKIGITAGANYSIPTGTTVKDHRKTLSNNNFDKSNISGRIGVRLGGVLSYQINEKVSFSTGLIYSQKGWKESFTSDEGVYLDYPDLLKTSFGYQVYEGDIKYKLNYIDIPLMVRYNLTKNIFVHGGIDISFLVKDEVNSMFIRQAFPFEEGEKVTEENVETFEDFFGIEANSRLFGFQFGIGVNLGKNLLLGIEIQKTGVVLNNGYEYDYSNATASISLTKYFSLKSKKE